METKEFVKLFEKCSVYDSAINTYKRLEEDINNQVSNGGEIRSVIEHGDYGYFEHESGKIVRLFLNTNRGRIEAFCTKHLAKCTMGADVNKKPGQYKICGNIFSK